MRIDDLLPLIPMLEGVKRGETWQAKRTTASGWVEIGKTEDVPILPQECYRKKPEPRVVWVAEYSGGLSSALFHSKDSAKQHAPAGCVGIVKFIEVPE